MIRSTSPRKTGKLFQKRVAQTSAFNGPYCNISRNPPVQKFKEDVSYNLFVGPPKLSLGFKSLDNDVLLLIECYVDNLRAINEGESAILTS